MLIASSVPHGIMREPMPPVPYLDADAIRAGVAIADMLDAVEAAYRDVATGRDRSPLRSRVELPNGDLLLMPGVREDGAGASVKLVTVTPANTERGLPTIHAVVAWFDSETGEPIALIDGATLTAMRTGAASGVATRLLARTDASTLAVIGAGAQAEWQLRAVLAARPIRRALVYAREATSREAFAARMAEVSGIEVAAAGSAEAAVRGADIVCCATTSSDPVFDADWVASGAHVNGIGAYRLGMVELPPEILARAALVAVDSHEAALAEAGDIVAAIERGLMAEEGLVEIGSIGPDWAAVSRSADAITVFKSVGLAIQDVAAAELITSRLLAVGDRE
jgi:ornithine cyclodeaminase/alanine dehydrogenase-like protein (mu-crystallin family)